MTQSINTSQPGTTFINLVDKFGGAKESDHHLRLKDGDEGKVLYVHSKNHGLPHKRSEIMQRRFDASQEVLKLFREHYSGSESMKAAAERVISHIVKQDLGNDGLETELQLRGTDVMRMYEMAEKELTFTQAMIKQGESLSQQYSEGVFMPSTVMARKGSGQDIELIQQPQVQGYAKALERELKHEISVLSTVALGGEKISSMVSGDVAQFRDGVRSHRGVLLSPDVLNAPGMDSLRPIVSVCVALDSLDVRSRHDFSVALKHGTGSTPSTPPPESQDVPGMSHVFNNRMNLARHQEWAVQQIETHFLGDADPLGLGVEQRVELRDKLAKIDEQIAAIKEQIGREPNKIKKEDLALALTELVGAKAKLIEAAINAPIEREQVALREQNANPMRDALTSLETESGRVEGNRRLGEFTGVREQVRQGMQGGV